MIIFEAVAVNVGSSLTAIGNPQNIFLWYKWGVSFPQFTVHMLLFTLLLLSLLFFMVFISFKSKSIDVNIYENKVVDKNLFFISILLLAFFIISFEFEKELYFLLIIALLFLVKDKDIVLKADWSLILLFVFIFIDINLITQIKFVHAYLTSFDFSNPYVLIVSSSIFSQLISNVPTTILLSNYTENLKILAYGVNIGGNGVFIASFANIIALGFIKDKSKYLLFHLYSVPFFLVSLLIVMLFLL
jgi:Na+/H+ antiporter NhaD/arsenite permease-like protein